MTEKEMETALVVAMGQVVQDENELVLHEVTSAIRFSEMGVEPLAHGILLTLDNGEVFTIHVHKRT
jgi:hypothetical protein